MTKYPFYSRDEKLSPALGVIITYISENESVNALDMSKKIGIAYSEIRRTLILLAQRGFIKRIFRGEYVIRDDACIIKEIRGG